MSRGPGKIERVLTDLFARSTGTDSVLSVADLCRHVFGNSSPPTRAQRISVLRAAHRVFVRARLKESLGVIEAAYWQMTERADRTVVFHNRDYPVRVWAVQIVRHGVIWAETQITSITKGRVNVRYCDEHASLDRSMLAFRWAIWRSVYFVSECNGFAARSFERVWAEHYGHLFPTLLPLEEAKRLLSVPDDYSREDILIGFRRAAKRCHPDHGGTAEQFRALVEARDRLLASIGITAPKQPKFRPAGVKVRYYVASKSTPRLSGGRARLHR
jgi:hypothetical protein